MTPEQESKLADFKADIIKDFGKRFKLDILVETGTWRAMTVHRCFHSFRKIFTIELDPELAGQAKSDFQNAGHVHVIEGDSGQMLYNVLKIVQEPCLLFLDAHNGTASTPVMTEIAVAFMLLRDKSVILIDDMRDFRGTNGYPTVVELVEGLKKVLPHYVVEVKDDILRAYPK